jgi:hypothetical protein
MTATGFTGDRLSERPIGTREMTAVRRHALTHRQAVRLPPPPHRPALPRLDRVELRRKPLRLRDQRGR